MIGIARRLLPLLAVNHRRMILLAMASVLVLSGCMLSPLFQAPAAIMTGIAVLLGLAACGGGGGGGGSTETPAPPRYYSLLDLFSNRDKGVVFIGKTNGDLTGASLAIGPSVNGNEKGTLVIGAPNANTYAELGTYNRAGRAYVVFGADGASFEWGGGGLALSTLGASEMRKFEGYSNSAYAGTSVAILGDTDGDGYADVAIGAPGEDRGWVAFGSSSMYSRYLNSNATYGLDHGILGFNAYDVNATGARGGKSIAGVDLDGDGYSDIAIGAPFYTNSTASHVTIVFGASDIDDTNGQINVSGANPNWIQFPGQTNFRTGSSLAKGRIKSSAIDDLIIGAPGPIDGMSGFAHVIFGNTDRSSLPTSLAGFGESGLEGVTFFANGMPGQFSFKLGEHVASGDVNGDGIDDILISDVRYNSSTDGTYHGRVWVVFGKSGGFGTSSFNVGTMQSSEGFSIVLPTKAYVDSLAVAKLRGDGFASDILIGSTKAQLVHSYTYSPSDVSASGYSNGAVFVVLGGSNSGEIDVTNMDGNKGFTVVGYYYTYVGASLAAGDITGDGMADVAVGAPNDDYYYQGRVFVVFGGSDGGLALSTYSLPTPETNKDRWFIGGDNYNLK